MFSYKPPKVLKHRLSVALQTGDQDKQAFHPCEASVVDFDRFQFFVFRCRLEGGGGWKKSRKGKDPNLLTKQ